MVCILTWGTWVASIIELCQEAAICRHDVLGCEAAWAGKHLYTGLMTFWSRHNDCMLMFGALWRASGYAAAGWNLSDWLLMILKSAVLLL